jgi:hypothetical protein
MLGRHFMVGVDYQGWAIEGGELPNKDRGSLQNLSATVTLIPGSPGSALGGWYIRAGAGLGWSGKGRKEVHIGEEIHGGERLDQFGYAVLGETGYEIWVHHNFSIAPGVAINYLDIGGKDETVTTSDGEEVTVRGVDRAGFGTVQITFNVYFGGDA